MESLFLPPEAKEDYLEFLPLKVKSMQKQYFAFDNIRDSRLVLECMLLQSGNANDKDIDLKTFSFAIHTDDNWRTHLKMEGIPVSNAQCGLIETDTNGSVWIVTGKVQISKEFADDLWDCADYDIELRLKYQAKVASSLKLRGTKIHVPSIEICFPIVELDIFINKSSQRIANA